MRLGYSGVPAACMPVVTPVQVPCGSRLVKSKSSSALNGSAAIPAEGTVPCGNSWPSDISWNRLNVEPATSGELITSESSSPELDDWWSRSR